MNSPQSIRRRARAGQPPGFTLLELLVTIAVIGIIAALLLSALSSAQLHAQQIQCVSNLRQLGVSGLMYCGDNKKYPPYTDPNFAGAGGFWLGTLMVVAEQKGINICPCAPLREPMPIVHGNGQGTADRAWVRWTWDNQLKFFSSYGFNSWLYTRQSSDPAKQPLLFQREANIQKPALTPVFADANWTDGDPLENEPPCRDLYAGSPLTLWADNIGRFTIARHGGIRPAQAPRQLAPGAKLPGAINMALADGHVELAQLENLWNYYWHLNWQVPAVRPP